MEPILCYPVTLKAQSHLLLRAKIYGPETLINIWCIAGKGPWALLFLGFGGMYALDPETQVPCLYKFLGRLLYLCGKLKE